MPMDFEPTTDEIKPDKMEMELTPVCIDARKKAKKAAARLANIMCHKTSKNYPSYIPKLQALPAKRNCWLRQQNENPLDFHLCKAFSLIPTTNLFKSQIQLAS